MEDSTNNQDRGLSRRTFLKAAGAAGAAAMASPALAGPKRRPIPDRRLARVVQIASGYVVDGALLHTLAISEMMETGIQELTQKATIKEAWGEILKPTDVVGLKFNRSGQRNIATTKVVAGVLIESLAKAGWSPKQIVCIEAPQEVQTEFSTRPGVTGFAPKEVDFGSGQDRLARVLDEVTALIDVPFLKTHNIAGMTCSLKNLSHGLVKHPARYHRNGCSPFVADIFALEQIRSKLRLCLVDALRVVFANGPDATVEDIHDSGTFLMGFDPVATDTAAFVHLNDVRRLLKLPPIGNTSTDVAYLAAAAERGLGTADLHAIDHIRLTA